MSAKLYQIEGAAFLLDALISPSERGERDAPPPSRLLADAQGTGKTVQASLAIQRVPDRVAVISCPAGMRRGWRRHLQEWCPRRPVFMVESEVDARRASAEILACFANDAPAGIMTERYPAPALVLSHDNVAAAIGGASTLRDLLGRRAVLVLDEAHFCKSPTAARSRGFRDAVRAAHHGGGCVWALTATPMPRDPIDLWVLLTWLRLAEWCFPGGLYDFAVGHFGGAEVQGRWRFPPRPPGGALGGRFAHVCLRRTREDVLPDLPEKVREVRIVPVEGAALSALDRVARAAAQAAGVSVDDLTRDDAPLPAVDLALEVGRRLEDLTELRVEMAKAKVPAMLAWVAEQEERGTPCAVYSDHLAPIEALGSIGADGAWSPRAGWVVIRGEDSDRARDAAVQAFESGEDADGRPVWGVAFTGAGRVGISLNRAEALLVVSRSWAHASEEQAEDRILRYGKVLAPRIVYLLLGHPLELLMHRVLAAKRTRSEVALSACARAPAAVPLPIVTPAPPPPPAAPALVLATVPDLAREATRDRRPWMSHKRLSTRRDCGFAENARYHLKVTFAEPPESRRLGILFAAAIAGRLVVWARDAVAAAGPEGDAVAAAEVKREAKENPWPQKLGSTEVDGRTAIELSKRTMERFGFFSGRWEPYAHNGRPAVECELRAPMIPASFPFADDATRAAAVAAVAGWAGFYGRCDLIAYDKEHRGGTGRPRLTVVDFKCKERMSEGLSDGADDLQLMLYLYAARAIGIPAELATRIEVRNKLPEEPAVVRGGKLSKDKAAITDVVLYEQAIKRHNLRREDYAEHLDWLSKEGPRCYQPVDCGRTTAALEQAWREMLWDASEMLQPRPVRHLRNFASSPCHSDRYGCEYKELCTATLPGMPTPESYARDLVQLGRLKTTSWRGPKTDDVGLVLTADAPAPQEH